MIILTLHSNDNTTPNTVNFIHSMSFTEVVANLQINARSSRVISDEKWAEIKHEVRDETGFWVTRTLTVKG